MKFSKIFFAATVSSLFVMSCTTTPVRKQATPSSAEAKQMFAKAQKFQKSNKVKEAIETYSQVATKFPESDLADDAQIAMGDIYASKSEYSKALAAYQEVTESAFADPAQFWEARQKSVGLLVKTNQTNKAFEISSESIQREDLPSNVRPYFTRVALEHFDKGADPVEQLKFLVGVESKSSDPAEREPLRLRASQILDTQITVDRLESITNNSSLGFLRGQASYKLGWMAFERGDFAKAKDYFEFTLEKAPDTDAAEKSAEALKQIESRSVVDNRTIGAVLPLSGKYSKIGQKALRGLQMGLGIYGKKPRSGIRLAVVDSEGSPALAQRGVEQLVMEDHAIAIVGGLLGKEAEAIAKKTHEFGVPLISLSQKAGLTQIGPEVFSNSITSEMQVRHLVDHLMRVKKLSRFAILYPNDPYGVEYANLFWDEVLARGGSIRAAQTYDPNEKDFRGPVQRLVGTFYLEDRAQEYRLRMQDWEKQHPSKTARTQVPKDLLPPIIDFEAVFIPDSVKAVGQIAPMLAYNDITDVTLVGTNLWNTRELISRAGKSLGEPVFVDSYMTTDKAFGSLQFNLDYTEIFGVQPEFFDIQAYDTGLFIKRAYDAGAASRVEFQSRLQDGTPFQGALGPLTVAASREVLRPLMTLTVKTDQIVPASENRQ